MKAGKLDWAGHWLKKPKRLYIGGEWIETQDSFETINPANATTLCPIFLASQQEVDAAVESASKAFTHPSWPGLGTRERAHKLRQLGQLVRDHREELATLESLENGKTYREAFEDDMPDAADIWDYYAGWTDKFYGESCPVEPGFLSVTKRESLGVCALIVPWNFPLLLAMWKMAPALATANTIVIKPSEYTSLSLLRFFELVDEAKIFPPGVINLVTGGASVGEKLSHHSAIAKVSFTGSTPVGQKIVQAAGASNLKQVTLELGGKSPDIFFEDTPDLDSALLRSFQVMFAHKGEKCTEPSRFFVQERLYPQFVEKIIPLANKIVCGDGFDPKTDQGPQCYREHFERVLAYIESGKKEGAKLLAGGEADVHGDNKRGYFIRPTIFGEVKNSMKIAQEEIFGPVLSLIPFRTEQEVLEMANDTSYGLAAGLYTKDISRAHRVADQLDAGMVFINHYGCYHFSTPFGGFKKSGWGKEMGRHSLEAYTKLKSIWVKY